MLVSSAGSYLGCNFSYGTSRHSCNVGTRAKLSVSEALFCLCRGTNIYNFLGCVRISRHVPRLFILFNFFYFSQWILYIAGARETQEDTL